MVATEPAVTESVDAESVDTESADAEQSEQPAPAAVQYYTRPAPRPRSANIGLLYVWVVVFGFVGTQLAWTLRPFLGSPSEPFQIFRPIAGNIYVDVVKTIGRLLGG
ncbi:MAG: hypothetical protein ACRD0P_09745, partial [Stackebrandtia sp.]